VATETANQPVSTATDGSTLPSRVRVLESSPHEDGHFQSHPAGVWAAEAAASSWEGMLEGPGSDVADPGPESGVNSVDSMARAQENGFRGSGYG
jgi:hypothetical protein